MKGTNDTQWGENPPNKDWQSIGSEHCVAERKDRTKRMERNSKPCDRISKVDLSLGPFCLVKEGQYCNTRSKSGVVSRQAMCVVTRSGSESRAERDWGILGTWESLKLPYHEVRAVQPSSRQGSAVEKTGSLSSLLLAFESRVTQLVWSL